MHAVRTAPAQIRIVREAENPWYEVTLIEGKNRQIRRMFEEIGHHVEKIKRVRYGPLALDVEPGQFRELTPREVATLRKAGGTRLRPEAGQRDFKAGMRYLGKPRPERRGPSRERPIDSGERAPGRAKLHEKAKKERPARFPRQTRSEQPQRPPRNERASGRTDQQEMPKQERPARFVRQTRSEHPQRPERRERAPYRRRGPK
jgi:23S rRNA pseudouridine2605 synthase